MKKIFLIWALLFSMNSFATDAAGGGSVALPPGVFALTGVPRVIREYPDVEVFFKDNSTPYVISKSGYYNQVLESVLSALKSKQQITVYVDKKTRSIVGMPGLATPKFTETEYEEAPSAAKKAEDSPSSEGGAPKK